MAAQPLPCVHLSGTMRGGIWGHPGVRATCPLATLTASANTALATSPRRRCRRGQLARIEEVHHVSDVRSWYVHTIGRSKVCDEVGMPLVEALLESRRIASLSFLLFLLLLPVFLPLPVILANFTKGTIVDSNQMDLVDSDLVQHGVLSVPQALNARVVLMKITSK